MTVPTNGHIPAAAGSIARTPSFTPITPVVKERVGDVATRLSEVERIIEDLNLQSATNPVRSPTIGDLQHEIDLLKKDIEETKSAQKKQIDGLRGSVKNDVKEQITKTMRSRIDKKIMESVEAQVKIEVGEWGRSASTKKFVEKLEDMVKDNDVLFRQARVKLDNSQSRHENSTLDEYVDFETSLSKIKLPDGNVSKEFPRTLKNLFSYDDHQLLQLFDEYGLRKLNTHLENLNRFLAFIGLRFSIPDQSLDFLSEPPAYTSPVLDPPKEENPPNVPPVSTPDQDEKKTEVTPEVKPECEKPPQEPAATNNNLAQVSVPEKRPEEKRIEEKNEAQRDLGGKKSGGIELSTFSRQLPNITTTQWPQQSILAHSARTANNNSPTQPLSSQESRPGMAGWFKSFTDGF